MKKVIMLLAFCLMLSACGNTDTVHAVETDTEADTVLTVFIGLPDNWTQVKAYSSYIESYLHPFHFNMETMDAFIFFNSNIDVVYYDCYIVDDRPRLYNWSESVRQVDEYSRISIDTFWLENCKFITYFLFKDGKEYYVTVVK